MTTSDPRLRASAREHHAEQFEMPENHLDVVVTPDSVDSHRKASFRTTVLAVVSMPLFFLLAFTLSYVSATHAPTPHHMAITVAGPSQVTDEISDTVQDRAEGAFDITQTTDPQQARDAVAARDAVGAVIVDGTNVTTIVASAAGRVATPVVHSLGDQIAQSLGGVATVEDVAPLPADDPGGSILFMFLVICTVGGFLSITVISQSMPKSGLRPLLATAVGAAVVVPVLGFSMISIFVDFEVPFGVVAAALGVGMLYTLTVALIASLFTLLLGQGAVLAVILFIVALSFPSSGGSVPESMLPPFWQGLHNSWLGSGAYESLRSILYFDGAQTGRWLTQLLIWTAVAIVLILTTAVVKRRSSAKTPPVAEPPVTPSAPDRAPISTHPAYSLEGAS